jgi:hypothetical protein
VRLALKTERDKTSALSTMFVSVSAVLSNTEGGSVCLEIVVLLLTEGSVEESWDMFKLVMMSNIIYFFDNK